jgi:hypothetical protein
MNQGPSYELRRVQHIDCRLESPLTTPFLIVLSTDQHVICPTALGRQIQRDLCCGWKVTRHSLPSPNFSVVYWAS